MTLISKMPELSKEIMQLEDENYGEIETKNS